MDGCDQCRVQAAGVQTPRNLSADWTRPEPTPVGPVSRTRPQPAHWLPLLILTVGGLGAGCTHPPLILPDASDLLVTSARNQMSPQAPTREISGERLADVPPGARCVVETTDSNPLRVVSGTVLMTSPSELVLRDGVVRRLDQRRLTAAAEESSTRHPTGPSPDWKLRDAIEEQRFEELRLRAIEIKRVSVYEAVQTSWKRLSEQPPDTADTSPETGVEGQPNPPGPQGWRPAKRGN